MKKQDAMTATLTILNWCAGVTTGAATIVIAVTTGHLDKTYLALTAVFSALTAIGMSMYFKTQPQKTSTGGTQ